MQNVAAGVGAFIVPYLALAQTSIPQAVEDVVDTSIGKYQCGLVRLDGGDNVFVFLCDVNDFDMLQINRRILRIVLQPA